MVDLIGVSQLEHQLPEWRHDWRREDALVARIECVKRAVRQA
jgi:hypothetical protein